MAENREALKPIFTFVDTVRDLRTQLERALIKYKATGDHDHGRGPIPVGERCGWGDDCHVRRAREALAVLREF